MTPIGGIVSKSKAAIYEYLARAIRPEAAWIALGVMLLVGAIAAIGYLSARLSVTHRMETELQQLRAEIDHLIQEEKASSNAMNESLRDLELTVYGELGPKVRRAVKPSPAPRLPLAQLEARIEELRQRTTQLERYRLQHQREHQ